MALNIAKMKDVLSKVLNPNLVERQDVNTIRNLSETIIDMCIAELNRNGILESSSAIVTLQDKKNCFARLIELFNASGQSLLPWQSADAPLDTIVPIVVANAQGVNPNDSEMVVDGFSNEAAVSVSSLLASSSSSSSSVVAPVVVAVKRKPGKKSKVTLEAEAAEAKRLRLAEQEENQLRLPLPTVNIGNVGSNFSVPLPSREAVNALTNRLLPNTTGINSVHPALSNRIVDTTNMPPLQDVLDGTYSFPPPKVNGRPIWTPPIAANLPPSSSLDDNTNLDMFGDEIGVARGVIVEPALDVNTVQKIAANRKAFVCDKVMDYICKVGTNIDPPTLARKSIEFGIAFDTLVNAGMLDPLAFVSPTSIPLVANDRSPVNLVNSTTTNTTLQKSTPIDSFFAPNRQVEIDALHELVEIFQSFDSDFSGELSNAGDWYKKAMKIIGRPFLRVSDILFILNSRPTLGMVGTFSFNDISDGHSLFKVISKNGEFMTLQHVHTVGEINPLFQREFSVKIPITMAILSSSGQADLLLSGHIVGLASEQTLGKLQAVDRKGKILTFRTAESLAKLPDMSFLHCIMGDNRSKYHDVLFSSDLHTLEPETFSTQLNRLADMERTMRDVGGISLDTPAVLTLEIVSNVGPVVNNFDVWKTRPRLGRFLKGDWSEAEMNSLSLLNFQAVGINGKCRHPTSMGDISQLLQNLEYVMQVVGCSSWSGLVHALIQKLNFQIVGLNLDIDYVMNTIHSQLCGFFHGLTVGVPPGLPIHNLVMVQKMGSAKLADTPLTKMGQLMNSNIVVYNPDKYANSSTGVPTVKKLIEEKIVSKEKSVNKDDKGMLC